MTLKELHDACAQALATGQNPDIPVCLYAGYDYQHIDELVLPDPDPMIDNGNGVVTPCLMAGRPFDSREL